jgi:pimeloyl-ACP methyl ester carboxylesterase
MPLLLLPGALGCAAQFDALLPHLNTQELHAFDYPAHGARRQERLDIPALPTLAADLLSYLQKHKLQGCPVFGHSMGGYLAVYMELQGPGTFSQITTLGTKWSWGPEQAAKEARKLDYEFLSEKAPFLIQRLQQYHGEERVPQMLELTRQILLDLGLRPLVHSLQALSCPVVTICLGELDRMVSMEESVALAESSALATFLHLPGAPHGFEEQDMQSIGNLIYQ